MLKAQRSCAVPRSLLQLGSGHIVRRRSFQRAHRPWEECLRDVYRPRDALSKNKRSGIGDTTSWHFNDCFSKQNAPKTAFVHNLSIPLFQWTVVGQPGLLGPPAARTAFTTGRWQIACKLIPLQKNSPNTLFRRVTYFQLRQFANWVAYWHIAKKTAYLPCMT